MRCRWSLLRVPAWFVLTLLCCPNCVCNLLRKPPPPTITGPDSAWVRAPVRFYAFDKDGSEIPSYKAVWIWGDGESNLQDPTHVYVSTGTYIVTCKQYEPGNIEELTEDVYSDPSNPCTLRILADANVYPDTVLDTIPVGQGTHDWACILPDGNRLYVTNRNIGAVSVVDTRIDSVIRTVSVGSAPGRCLSSNSGHYVFVANTEGNSVSVIRTSDDSVVATIRTPRGPGAMTILPNDSILYVAHEAEMTVSGFSVSDGAQVGLASLDGRPAGLAMKSGGDLIYAACENGIHVVQTSDYTVASVIPMSGAPSDLLFSATGETACVTCPSTDSIVMLQVRDNSRISQASFGDLGLAYPWHPTMSSGGQRFYIVGSWGNDVGIVRSSDYYLTRLIRVGRVLDPSGARVAIEHPAMTRVYVPTDYGVVVLGLRPSP